MFIPRHLVEKLIIHYYQVTYLKDKNSFDHLVQ